jgi:hypothetical protein
MPQRLRSRLARPTVPKRNSVDGDGRTRQRANGAARRDGGASAGLSTIVDRVSVGVGNLPPAGYTLLLPTQGASPRPRGSVPAFSPSFRRGTAHPSVSQCGWPVSCYTQPRRWRSPFRRWGNDPVPLAKSGAGGVYDIFVEVERNPSTPPAFCMRSSQGRVVQNLLASDPTSGRLSSQPAARTTMMWEGEQDPSAPPAFACASAGPRCSDFSCNR